MDARFCLESCELATGVWEGVFAESCEDGVGFLSIIDARFCRASGAAPPLCACAWDACEPHRLLLLTTGAGFEDSTIGEPANIADLPSDDAGDPLELFAPMLIDARFAAAGFASLLDIELFRSRVEGELLLDNEPFLSRDRGALFPPNDAGLIGFASDGLRCGGELVVFNSSDCNNFLTCSFDSLEDSIFRNSSCCASIPPFFAAMAAVLKLLKAFFDVSPVRPLLRRLRIFDKLMSSSFVSTSAIFLCKLQVFSEINSTRQ
jgi:hypothetical protein